MFGITLAADVLQDEHEQTLTSILRRRKKPFSSLRLTGDSAHTTSHPGALHA
jgi:hypothetical protein